MQVLILEDDPAFQAQLAQAMMAKGFNVLGVESVPAAEAFLRLDMADVLVFGERIGGRLAHPVALMAECRNPLVAAVLLTDRSGPDLDELFDLMPALVGILGRRVAPAVVTQVVMSAVAEMASDSVRNRIATRWAAAERAGGADPAAPPARLRPAATAWSVVPAADRDAALEADLTAPDTAGDMHALPVPDPALVDGSASDTPALAGVSPAPVSDMTALAGTDVLATFSDAPDRDTGLRGTSPATIPDLSAVPPDVTAVAPVRVLAAVLPVVADVSAPSGLIRAPAPLPPPRLAKPSPDSPLARLLATGQRAALPAVPVARPAVAVSAPLPGALPSWLTPPLGAPAAPAPPASLPWQRPAQPGERRLHLA
jgi:hypothetical protein